MGRARPSSAMLSLIAESKLAVLGTNGPHGPHLAPVWFLYRDDVFLVVTGVMRRKAKNIQHDYRVGLTVLAHDGSPAVMLDGTARLDHVGVISLIEEAAVRYLGAEGGARYVQDLTKTFTKDTLWRIVVTPTWWKSWGLDEPGMPVGCRIAAEWPGPYDGHGVTGRFGAAS